MPGARASPGHLAGHHRYGCMTGPGLSTRAGVLCGGLVHDALEVIDRDGCRALPGDAQEPSGVGNDREALFGDLLDADPKVLGQGPLDRPELLHVETGQNGEMVPVPRASLETPCGHERLVRSRRPGLHDSGQEALLELELATLDMSAHEKWALEQVLLAYVADSVPVETWHEGLEAGIRAVRRDRERGLTHESPAPD